MKVTKTSRAVGGAYLISKDNTDNPKLAAKTLSDGRDSLFLEYYFGMISEKDPKTGREVKKKDRKRESLKLYIWHVPRNTEERQHNRDVLELAKRVRFEKEQELLKDLAGYRLKRANDINFHDWAWAYYEAYTHAGDKRQVLRACRQFIEFLNSKNEYQKFAKRIKPEQITPQMVVGFVDFLKDKYVGEGPNSVYSRFKKILKAAVISEILKKNPCDGITIKVDNEQLKKDVLSIEEVERLIATHYEGENPNIRRAFIFSALSGIRWCDVKALTFRNVDYSNRLLKFEQNKTKGHSAASSVVIPLNDYLLSIIGKPASTEDGDALIFPLPSHTMALKALRHWTKRAGITKHITWHCARHSFATYLLSKGANIRTVASLLGHSGLKYVEKYTRAVDSLKVAAINGICQTLSDGDFQPFHTPLNTEIERECFKRAIKSGYMEREGDKCTWIGTVAELGYFCFMLYEAPIPQTKISEYFGIKESSLSAAITNASLPARTYEGIGRRAAIYRFMPLELQAKDYQMVVRVNP